jgi:hypothetical protein
MGASVVSVSAGCRLGVGRIFQATPSFLLFPNWLRSRVSRVSGNSYLAVHMRAHMPARGRVGARYTYGYYYPDTRNIHTTL